jgi:hypothetical protein
LRFLCPSNIKPLNFWREYKNTQNKKPPKKRGHHESIMSFLQDAQISAICILASSVRAVLCEASAQALQQRIKCRLDKNETDATSPVEITAQDVDAAYQTANRVAERWVIELKKVGEVDAASVVEKVRLSGNFLEDGFVDDVALDDMDEMELTGEGEDPMDSIVSNLNASFQPTSTPMSIDQKDCGEKINMKELIDDRELPKEFSMVSKNFGCRDPCQVELDATLQPSSTQWYRLPEESDDLNSSRPVHIPEPTNLPPSQIQSLPPNQLYGAPSPSLALDHHNPFGYLLGKNGSLHEQFLKQQIKILDELGSMNQTLWIGEWDVMERATDLVRKRNHLLPSKRKIQNKKDDFFLATILLFRNLKKWTRKVKKVVMKMIPWQMLHSSFQKESGIFSKRKNVEKLHCVSYRMGEAMVHQLPQWMNLEQKRLDERHQFWVQPGGQLRIFEGIYQNQ